MREDFAHLLARQHYRQPCWFFRALYVPWLIFIAVGLVTYAGFLKLGARLLRYKTSWKSSFLFAFIVLALVIFDHVLAFN